MLTQSSTELSAPLTYSSAQSSDGTPPVDVPFWPEAIERIRFRRPDFVMLSEVYWDLEATLKERSRS